MSAMSANVSKHMKRQHGSARRNTSATKESEDSANASSRRALPGGAYVPLWAACLDVVEGGAGVNVVLGAIDLGEAPRYLGACEFD